MRFAFILLLVPTAIGSPVITELYPEPDGDREFIELHNPTDQPIDLTGYRIEDAAGNAFALDGHTLAPFDRMVVWGGGEATAEGPAWSRATVWNNGGDTATLYHGDVAVDAYQYDESPGLGRSWMLHGTWQIADPSPGLAPGEAGGQASATVENVAPTIQLSAPPTATPGEAVTLHVAVSDDNGDAVSWTVADGAAIVAQGTEGRDLSLQAPANGPWVLTGTVTDGTANGTTQVSIHIRAEHLEVLIEDPVTFPAMVPGATNVTASNPFRIINHGDAAVPRIDISDFRGPTRFMPEVMSLVIDGTAHPYEGPLTALPPLPAGAHHEVWLRIDQVPLPLPAGTYGTSFTVIA